MALGKSMAEINALDYAEIQLWAAYSQTNPWGEERADYRAGIVASTVANAARSFSTRRGKTFSPKDFMPKFKTPGKKQTADQMRRALKAATNG